MLSVKFIVGIFVVGHTSDFAHQHARLVHIYWDSMAIPCVYAQFFAMLSCFLSTLRCFTSPGFFISRLDFLVPTLSFFFYFFPFICWRIENIKSALFSSNKNKIYVILYSFATTYQYLFVFYIYIYFSQFV